MACLFSSPAFFTSASSRLLSTAPNVHATMRTAKAQLTELSLAMVSMWLNLISLLTWRILSGPVSAKIFTATGPWYKSPKVRTRTIHHPQDSSTLPYSERVQGADLVSNLQRFRFSGTLHALVIELQHRSQELNLKLSTRPYRTLAARHRCHLYTRPRTCPSGGWAQAASGFLSSRWVHVRVALFSAPVGHGIPVGLTESSSCLEGGRVTDRRRAV